MSDQNLQNLNGIVAFSRKEYDDYQKYLSSKKEWAGLNIKSQVTLNLPMLIMELYRLIPYKESRYIHFHPFNMPYIKVRKIDLVGIVTHIKHNGNNLFLTIEDGTGVAEIDYKFEQNMEYMSSLKKRTEIDEKYREQAKNLKKSKTIEITDCPKKFPKTRPGFSYPHDTYLQDIAILENKWWLETDGGLLGKKIEPFDYVYVKGYLCLDKRFQNISQKITTEFIENSRLKVFAVSVSCISEETYNKKLSVLIGTTIYQRYKER